MTTAVAGARTTCPYCGVGCGVIARVEGGRLTAVEGDPAHPANRGRLCVKGSALTDTQYGAQRLLTPRVDGMPATWNSALDRIAETFSATLRDHGPDAVGMYLSGQLLTEDYYVANKLMKGFLGSANVDTNSRLCMASAVAAHKRAFGEDVVPCDYADLDHCELLVLVGSNAAWAHPVLFRRIETRHRRGELRVVVIDPRRTATCESADLHLALRPGSDVALFNGLLTHLADHGGLDREYLFAHTDGFDQAVAAARADAVELPALSGLDPADLDTFMAWFTATPRTVTLFSQGVNQAGNGTDKATAIINCHLASGRIGKLGMGPFSITGQPNAMGGREVGGMANQLAAHSDFDPPDLDRLRRFWDAPALATGPGRKAVELFDGVARGEIRALWILGTNPVVSLPQADRVRQALHDCRFVVVSDCVARTDTTACADVLLPAAGWGEKDGTVTNSERCISRQRAFLPLAGEARPDWWALSEVARRLGFATAFDYPGPHAIFAEHAALSAFENPGRVFDIGALGTLDEVQYDALTPRQWPTARPFADGFFSTPNGRARLVAVRHRAPIQQPDTAHPLVLNSGRLRDQWHTMTRTGTAPRLLAHADTPTVQISETDAARLGIAAGDLIELSNELGLVRAVADPGASVSPGHLFMAMHWNDRFAWPARVGTLVDAAVDPVSGQPESKHATVKVRRCEPGGWLRIVCRCPLGAREIGAGVLFWTRLPATAGWRHDIVLAPGHSAADWLDALRRRTAHGNALAFDDPGHGDHRLLLEDDDGGLLLAAFGARQRSDLPAAAWLAEMLDPAIDLPRWRLLAGPASTGADTSATVCTCFGVTERTIRATLAEGAVTVADLGERLRCGTNCGSCLPELGLLVRTAGH